MAKRFNLKLSRVIPSFQFCRPKKPSNLAETPGPAIHRLSPVNPKALDICYPNLPAPPPTTPDDSFVKRRFSPEIASLGCGCRTRSCTQHFSPDASFESLDYSSKKETTRLRVVAKTHNSKLQRENEIDKKKTKKKEVKAIAASVSSRDSGCFSSEGTENEETETLITTSLSFSDDSSFEMDQSLADESHMETKKSKKKVMKRLRSFGSKKYRGSSKPNSSKTKGGAMSSENIETLARGSMTVQPQAAEGKVSESVAVITKSEDPYEDFKRSMLEMILEKQMFEAKDLEQLLQCFLSLNSSQHHEIIVEAFAEIWEALFCDYPMNAP
ncbi:ARABIDOPSIS THALIANA OVATE FAMILY PROTEIN 7, ovate family protein 7 [Hibiscus trionum]|uniref:Transcription repressor n=1 Tax=Hibiscus trionum TaxID=183268 RepID=A0A9W7HT61_HIBTR|nr:ARABIDOPSIS THALIANA OVATE FAMILY PROTEIN 7, ovate family protein 7 [Hibiscus trionum]